MNPIYAIVLLGGWSCRAVDGMGGGDEKAASLLPAHVRDTPNRPRALLVRVTDARMGQSSVVKVMGRLTVRIYMGAGELGRHRGPHFHVVYPGGAVVVLLDCDPPEFDNGDTGSLNAAEVRRVRRWAKEHRDELLACWNRARKYEYPGEVDC